MQVREPGQHRSFVSFGKKVRHSYVATIWLDLKDPPFCCNVHCLFLRMLGGITYEFTNRYFQQTNRNTSLNLFYLYQKLTCSLDTADKFLWLYLLPTHIEDEPSVASSGHRLVYYWLSPDIVIYWRVLSYHIRHHCLFCRRLFFSHPLLMCHGSMVPKQCSVLLIQPLNI